MSLIWDDSETAAVRLQPLIDRSRIQLELAKASGDEDAANWAAEMLRAAKEEQASLRQVEAERMSWALRTRNRLQRATPGAPHPKNHP